jgi:hypothetical protein
MDKATLDTLLSRKSDLEGLLSTIDIWLLVFGIFVVIGVAGESIFGITAWLTHRRLNPVLTAIADEQRAETQRETAQANERAGKANERAAELLALIQPRALTVEQQRIIGNSLVRFKGHKISIWSYDWDLEGYMLSKQIVAACNFAHLDVTDNSGKALGGVAGQSGISISWWLTGDLAEAVGRALETSGLQNVVVTEGKGGIAKPDGTMTPSPIPILNVWVCAKPLPLLK